MMRDYQRIKQTKYILPRTVYHQTLWRIRDYYRLKEEANNLIECKGEIGEKVKNNSPSDRVLDTVIKREKYIVDIKNIEQSLNKIPFEYRKGIWDNIQFDSPYPLDADRSTYGRYKSKFIYLVAERFKLI